MGDRGRGTGRPDSGRGGPGRGGDGGRGGGRGYDDGGRGRGGGGGGRGPEGGGGRGGGGGGRGGARFGGPYTPDLAAKEMTALFQGLTLTKAPVPQTALAVVPQLAQRPGYGKAGRPIKVLANYFKLLPQAHFGDAFHYDVDMVIERPPKAGSAPSKAPPAAAAAAKPPRAVPAALTREVLAQLAAREKWPPVWCSDGNKSIYSPVEFLPSGDTVFTINVKEQTEVTTFKVKTKLVNVIDLKRVVAFVKQGGEVPRLELQALDVMLMQSRSRDKACMTVGRAFYYPCPDYDVDLGANTSVVSGYRQALKVCVDGLYLSSDTAFSAFVRAADVIVMFAEILRQYPKDFINTGFDGRTVKMLEKHLRGLRVTQDFVTPTGTRTRERTVFGLMQDATVALFMNEQGKLVSVADYFTASGRKLKYPKLPCVIVGNKVKPCYIPAELCKVVQGPQKRKMDAMQTSTMIKTAAQKPHIKIEAILKGIQSSGLATDEMLKAWGLKLGPVEMAQVDARVLPPPKIAYATPNCYDVGSTGSWNLAAGACFLDPKSLSHWVVACTVPANEVDIPGPAGIRGFLQELGAMLARYGLTVPTAAPSITFPTRPGEAVSDVMKRAKAAADAAKIPVQLMLVILPRKEVEPYRVAKVTGDSVLGVVSQCITQPAAGLGARNQKPDRLQYLFNVALKINCKLDGVNSGLFGGERALPALPGNKPIMFMGADVTHFAKGSSEPSIAAVVATRDRTLARYNTVISLNSTSDQRPREVIQGMQEATTQLLKGFYAANGGVKPAYIIMYRDGVAEGQFQEVLAHEFLAIRKACNEISSDYHPLITFIIVQKNHNTRLLPPNGSPDVDRSGNCLPGTVVDSALCTPMQFDFFLNSHAGIQGTNKPAHYHVLVDEIGFGADGLQLLTYWLCYMYARCTRSVSYCPPAYYAHHAAFRARMMMTLSDDMSSETSGSSSASRYQPLHPALNSKLYYM